CVRSSRSASARLCVHCSLLRFTAALLPYTTLFRSAAFLGELDDHLDRIVMANEPSVLPSDVVEHLRGLALQTFEDHLGNHQAAQDRKSTRLNSSHGSISYAVFCLKKKNYTA